MKSHTAEYQAWQDACSHERAAWLSVQESPVGGPLDAQAWQRWRESLDREAVALQALLQAQAQITPARRRSDRRALAQDV